MTLAEYVGPIGKNETVEDATSLSSNRTIQTDISPVDNLEAWVS